VIWGFMTLKTENFERHLFRGHFLESSRAFDPLCLEIGSRVWAARVVMKQKTKQNCKSHRIRIYNHLSNLNQIWQIGDCKTSSPMLVNCCNHLSSYSSIPSHHLVYKLKYMFFRLAAAILNRMVNCNSIESINDMSSESSDLENIWVAMEIFTTYRLEVEIHEPSLKIDC